MGLQSEQAKHRSGLITQKLAWIFLLPAQITLRRELRLRARLAPLLVPVQAIHVKSDYSIVPPAR